MNLQVDVERVYLAQKAVRAELLSERAADGHWIGQVASSPFATASAISALVLGHRSGTEEALREHSTYGDGSIVEQIVQGDLCELLLESVHWLARNQNPDGGWGDCDRGQSNIAATMLVQAAFRLTGIPAKYADLMVRADQYVDTQGSGSGLWREFGGDKPLVAAVLANAALADMVSWRQVPVLAFETACLPKSWQRRLPPPASPAALPAYLAVGRAKLHHDPPRNPITRLLRRCLATSSVAALGRLQSPDGGFADSIPTTSFVVMCLASIGYQDHSVVQRGIEFLLSSVQSDASWRATNNLAVRITTWAVNQLAADQPDSTERVAVRTLGHGGEAISAALPSATWEDTARVTDVAADTAVVGGALAAIPEHLSDDFREDELILDERCLNWLLDAQRTTHDPATDVPPGGWGWSSAPGALPNSLDTASALLSLVRWRRRFAELQCERIDRASALGVGWLLDLQQDGGGWPTFSRGGYSDSFGASGAEVTAMALRALEAWQSQWQAEAVEGGPRQYAQLERGIDAAIERGWRFLESRQSEDGHFVPLWFGNEQHPESVNPVVGTAQVLAACADLRRLDCELAHRAANWLVTAQHANGGWGPPRAPLDYSGAYKDGFRAWRANDALAKFSSVEETALAVSALLPLIDSSQAISRAVDNGLAWLAGAIEQDAHRQGAVIGFYFTGLWYHERLYPLVFAVGALSRAVRRLEAQRHLAAPVGVR